MKTQREKILELLQHGKVNSYQLTYTYGIKQAPTRIHELRKMGYNIVTSPIKKDGSVDYELMEEILKPVAKISQEPEKTRTVKYFDNGVWKQTYI